MVYKFKIIIIIQILEYIIKLNKTNLLINFVKYKKIIVNKKLKLNLF